MALLKVTTIVGVALLVVCVGCAVWTFRYSGPTIETWEKDGSVFVANVHLGEYYLGFTEVVIKHQAKGRQVLHASRGAGELITQIELGPPANICVALAAAGWTVAARDADCVLSPGTSYQVILRGNNGFGYDNRRKKMILIPQAEIGGMPNNAFKLTVRSVTALADVRP